jgi:hypothetical protein
MSFKPVWLSYQTACASDAREAVKALIVANHFLDAELEKLRAAVSNGYPLAEKPSYAGVGMFGLVTLKKTNLSSKKIGNRSRRSNDGGVDAALGKRSAIAIQNKRDA